MSTKFLSSRRAKHPVDRSGLGALEVWIGEECAIASCLVNGNAFAVVIDQRAVRIAMWILR